MTTKLHGARVGTTSPGERHRVLPAYGKHALATLVAAICILGCGAATAAAEGPPATGALVEFEYRLSNVKSVGLPEVTYTGGVVANGGGSVTIQSGAVAEIVFLNVNPATWGWGLVSVGSAPLTATVDDRRYVDSATVTGTATIPSGSSMTVTDVQTGQTTTLKNGSFSIPTGVGGNGLIAAPTAATHALRPDAATAAAKTFPATKPAEFDYMVSNVATDSAIFPSVLYTGGVYDGLGAVLGDQTLSIQSGAIKEARFFTNGWFLVPTGATPLTAKLFDRRYVDSATVTGTAGVAAGSSMTVTLSNTGQTITINNGDFSIPSGIGGPPPTTPTSKEQCRHGGWKNFGGMFKNQGQCVSFVAEQQA